MALKYFVDSDAVVLKVVKSRFGQDRILFLRFGENIMASELVICRVNPERRFWPRPVVILQYFYRPVAATWYIRTWKQVFSSELVGGHVNTKVRMAPSGFADVQKSIL